MNNAIKAICESMNQPFYKERASDELDYVPFLPRFLNSFKPLMISDMLTN